MVIRHKPTKQAKEATHEAQTSDYQKLAEAVVKAIILKQRDVVFRTPYFVVFADDVPKGILIRKTAEHNYYRAKAFKLADWLHAKGFLPADAKGIVLSTRDLVYREARLNKILIDNSRADAYNERSVVDEAEQIEKESNNAQ